MQGCLDVKDTYDGIGQYKHNLCYENVDNDIGHRNISTITVYDSSDVAYSYNCHGSQNLFGCIGLRKKSYCILNKQYAEEEYKALMPKIIGHMNAQPYVDTGGRIYAYGEFFPFEISPFAYNETLAQDYFPLSKAEIVDIRKYPWRPVETKGYQITLESSDIPDRIHGVGEDILNQTIACLHQGECHDPCTTAFRVTGWELQFYRKMGVPLPRLCPNCRHYQRLKKTNPLKLWHRACECEGQMSKVKGQNAYRNMGTHQHGTGKCPNEFETSYSPDRPEIVYCEGCYQQEVA
jgi:hypothetical protein